RIKDAQVSDSGDPAAFNGNAVSVQRAVNRGNSPPSGAPFLEPYVSKSDTTHTGTREIKTANLGKMTSRLPMRTGTTPSNSMAKQRAARNTFGVNHIPLPLQHKTNPRPQAPSVATTESSSYSSLDIDLGSPVSRLEPSFPARTQSASNSESESLTGEHADLKLFQAEYDTFTRDKLFALVTELDGERSMGRQLSKRSLRSSQNEFLRSSGARSTTVVSDCEDMVDVARQGDDVSTSGDRVENERSVANQEDDDAALARLLEESLMDIEENEAEQEKNEAEQEGMEYMLERDYGGSGDADDNRIAHVATTPDNRMPSNGSDGRCVRTSTPQTAIHLGRHANRMQNAMEDDAEEDNSPSARKTDVSRSLANIQSWPRSSTLSVRSNTKANRSSSPNHNTLREMGDDRSDASSPSCRSRARETRAIGAEVVTETTAWSKDNANRDRVTNAIGKGNRRVVVDTFAWNRPESKLAPRARNEGATMSRMNRDTQDGVKPPSKTLISTTVVASHRSSQNDYDTTLSGVPIRPAASTLRPSRSANTVSTGKSSTSSAITRSGFSPQTAATSMTSVTSGLHNLTLLRPRDELPDHCGNMAFDHTNSRWVNIGVSEGEMISDPFEGLEDVSANDEHRSPLLPAIAQKATGSSVTALQRLRRESVASVAVQTLDPVVQDRAVQTRNEKKEIRAYIDNAGQTKRPSTSTIYMQTKLVDNGSMLQPFGSFPSRSEQPRNARRGRVHVLDDAVMRESRPTQAKNPKNLKSPSSNRAASRKDPYKLSENRRHSLSSTMHDDKDSMEASGDAVMRALLAYQISESSSVPTPGRRTHSSRKTSAPFQLLERSFTFAKTPPQSPDFFLAMNSVFRVISNTHPYHEWNAIRSLDLSGHRIENVCKLDAVLPGLESLILLTTLESFAHLANLEFLDVSDNDIVEVTGISSLRHLREFYADFNRIESCVAMGRMEGLLRLSLQGNNITEINFGECRLQRLEVLNLSKNQIQRLENLEPMSSLTSLNLDSNDIQVVNIKSPLAKLQIVRLNFNSLIEFDANGFVGLRTLYIDENRMMRMHGAQSLARLDSFSLREQDGADINIELRHLRNVRKLYLSGNSMRTIEPLVGFFKLEYLELASAQLKELPADLSRSIPNVAVINFSYNSLEDLSPLIGLEYLKRLMVVGNNLKDFGSIFEVAKSFQNLEVLDLRQNPMTFRFYPPITMPTTATEQGLHYHYILPECDAIWHNRDETFCRSLPSNVLLKRVAFRCSMMKICSQLYMLDGRMVEEKDRAAVDHVLKSLAKRKVMGVKNEDDGVKESKRHDPSLAFLGKDKSFIDAEAEAEAISRRIRLEKKGDVKRGRVNRTHTDVGLQH
ncbi:hypothetical protein BC936DRAFT_147163, partial [Jimgerdemannia flammicorona]